RDSGEARTIAELEPDEVATVIVEVRSISSRPVRRRGMKPLGEGVVSDATGVMKATFFNQPWLKDQYKAGTRLMLAGKYQGANRFRVNSHARTDAGASAAAPAQTPSPARRSPPRSTPRQRAPPRRRSSPPCASTATPWPTWSSRC